MRRSFASRYRDTTLVDTPPSPLVMGFANNGLPTSLRRAAASPAERLGAIKTSALNPCSSNHSCPLVGSTGMVMRPPGAVPNRLVARGLVPAASAAME